MYALFFYSFVYPQLADSDIKHELSIKQARKRMFTVGKYQIVVNAEAHIGQKVVSFVSLLQVSHWFVFNS